MSSGKLALILASFPALSACAGHSSIAPGSKAVSVGWLPVGGVVKQKDALADDRANQPQTDQQYNGFAMVRYFIPGNHGSAPVVMMPGLGLSSNIYLSTPDGRPGWVTKFLARDLSVYLYDEPDSSASALDTRPANDPEQATKELKSTWVKWGMEDAWSRFGIGPSYGRVYQNSRFPAEYYTTFAAAFTVLPGGTSPFAKRSGTEALSQLNRKIGPMVLLAHSAAGSTALEYAKQNPSAVSALILVEPVGCLGENELEESPLLKIPTLVVYGDYLNKRNQTERYNNCKAQIETSTVTGSKFIDYPSKGVKGNSHIMMGDTNSNEIAGDILKWLEGQAK